MLHIVFSDQAVLLQQMAHRYKIYLFGVPNQTTAKSAGNTIKRKMKEVIEEAFDVPQAEVIKTTGLSRSTLFRHRQAGLPTYRDPQTGHLLFRKSDVQRLTRWANRSSYRELFQ